MNKKQIFEEKNIIWKNNIDLEGEKVNNCRKWY